MRNFKKFRILIISLLVLVIAAGSIYFLGMFVPSHVNSGKYSTLVVERGEVALLNKATGIVDSENEVLILSPGPGVIQKIMTEPGSHVKKDQILMQLHTEDVLTDIEKMKSQIEVRLNNLERTRLNAQSTRLDLDYDTEVKKLKITSLKSQLADQQQLLEVGGISPARIAQTQQEVTLAEKDLQTIVAKNSIRLKQLESEEKGLLLQIRIQEKELEEMEQLLQKMSIKAPSSGIILSVSGKEGEKVGTDNLLVRMSDLTSFKIIGSVDEKNAVQLKTGNKVLVYVDGEKLEGTMGNITPLVENNKIQFNVHLKESNHPKLIPNQQVEIQIINNLRENTLRIKKYPGFEEDKVQKMFVIQGNLAVKKEVTLGTIGNDYFEILSGLKEGDRVVTDGLNANRHLNEIEIR